MGPKWNGNPDQTKVSSKKVFLTRPTQHLTLRHVNHGNLTQTDLTTQTHVLGQPGTEQYIITYDEETTENQLCLATKRLAFNMGGTEVWPFQKYGSVILP